MEGEVGAMKELSTDDSGHIEGDGSRIRPAQWADDALKRFRKPRKERPEAKCTNPRTGFERAKHEPDKDNRCIFCSKRAVA